MISLSGLNPHQREAASTCEGPVLILAGAGSGKTRTLTYRIAHMVSNLNIAPSNILAVSFTNKAAKEMKERVIGLLGKRKVKGMTLSTFHSLGVKVLKKEIELLGYHKNFSIYDTNDQLAIIRGALKKYKAEKQFDRKTILSKIGYLKNHGISAETYAESFHFNEEDPYDVATEYVFHYYEDQLKFFNAIDFDDILYLTVKLFKEHPEVAKRYSEDFHYIMVDEYQDTNDLQFDLIRCLTSTHDNLCVVGDDDQSIYSFRGANIKNILNFEKHYPNAKIIKLEENYRSTTPILTLANEVIKSNKDRRDKTLWSKNHSEVIPKLWSTADGDHEAQIVVEGILDHQKRGEHLGDIAILYRSNTQIAPFEDELRLSNIPYKILGGQKLYEKKEVKDLIAYLTVIINPHDQIALRRILNIPHRGIGNKTLDKYLKRSEETKKNLYDTMNDDPDLCDNRGKYIRAFTDIIEKYKKTFQKHTLSESITSLIEEIKYFEFIESHYDSAKQVDRRKNDIHQFLESAERFSRTHANSADLKTFVEKLLLQDSQDNRDEEEEEDTDVRKNEVTLMTLHSSKGLEFNKVFLVGMEEEILPHKNTIKNGEDIGEERRLCYVGITRAKEELIMTYCKERTLYGKKAPRHKSRFIHELERDDLVREVDRNSFGDMTDDEVTKHKKDFFANLMANLDS